MADRACVAVIRAERVLMVRQTYRGETIWTFPGGSIEPGESAADAAVREAREETGLDVGIIRLAYRGPRRSGHGTYTCFLGHVIGGALRLGDDLDARGDNELHAVRWFSLSDVRDHPEVALCLARI